MLPNSSKLCNSESSALQSHHISELNSLFLFLIESCINHSSSEEQRSLAQYIEPLFNSAVEINPLTYSFLTPQFSSPIKQLDRKIIIRKEETPPNLKKTKTLITNKRKSKQSLSPSTSKDPLSHSPFGLIKLTSPIALSNANTRDDIIQRLLKALELSADELATIILSKLLQGYITYCKAPVIQRRLRRMVRLDGTSYCLRAMRVQLEDANPSPLKILALDAIAKTLINISVKDRKFMLKVRISGLLSLLANRVLEADRLFTTVTLLRFSSRCLRSPRNAQLIGKEKRFAERFVALLNTISATMDYPRALLSSSSSNIATARDYSFSFDVPFLSTLIQKNPENNNLAEKMARLVEILYFAAKNKRNKSQLLDNQVVCVLKTIFENHFEHRHSDTIHLEIALISLATIRQFSKTKKGKEQLKNLSILAMCEKCINVLTEDKRKLYNRPKTLTLYSQLQDSLCSLCLRCLPQLQFPIIKKSFPLKFLLPIIKNSLLESSSNQSSLAKQKVVKPRSISPTKRRSLNKQTPLKNYETIVEDNQSSDDGNYDEEEDSILFFDSSEFSGDLRLCNPNETDVNYSDEDDDFQATSSSQSKIDSLYIVSNYNRQSLSKLKSNYQQHFIELEHDAIASGDSSPKLRKTSISPNITSNQAMSSESDRSSRSRPNIAINISRQTKSVGKFVQVAHPELCNLEECVIERQAFLLSTESMREMAINVLSKSRLQNMFKQRVVFDLDNLIAKQSDETCDPIGNIDFSRIGCLDNKVPHLKFESRFESGNLRQAIQVSEFHYELVLSPDINQQHPHYQWFYFEVSNNQANSSYTFEIINCLKNSSMFSRGMQPVLYSVTEASQGRPGWVRAASSVCYYRNLYTNEETRSTSDEKIDLQQTKPTKTEIINITQTPTKNSSKKNENETRCYFSTRFTLVFKHAADVCYIAYHYPYTFSYLRATLEFVISNSSSNQNIYFRNNILTNSLAGNPIYLLTITARGSLRDLKEREVVLFSARVHPGESNSSWIMHGIIKFLTSDSLLAIKVRELFIFKIIPMLNPDGVINGSHRCSLSGVDLNRVWNNPSSELHPTIYHTKGIIQYMAEISKKSPFVFVDLHGHSRRANIFMYGNNPEESWRPTDHSIEHNFQFLALPEILEKIAPGFSFGNCHFSITKAKEFSARIAMWRQFNLIRAYTLEATYCGFDSGRNSGKQIAIDDFMGIGASLCEAIMLVKNGLNNLSHISDNIEK